MNSIMKRDTTTTNAVTSISPLLSASSSQQVDSFSVVQVSNVAESSSSLQGENKASSSQVGATLLLTQASQLSPDEFPFKSERAFVPDTFWDLMKESIPQKLFYQHYRQFILTNWQSSNVSFKALIRERRYAVEPKRQYLALIQLDFQYGLKLNATRLIHSVLTFGRHTEQLKIQEKRQIITCRSGALFEINSNFESAYKKYKEYMVRRQAISETEDPSDTDIENLKKEVNKARKSIGTTGRVKMSRSYSVKDENEIPKNLEFINLVLNKIKDGNSIKMETAIDFAKKYKPYTRNSISRPDETETRKREGEDSSSETSIIQQKKRFPTIEQLLSNKRGVAKFPKHIKPREEALPQTRIQTHVETTETELDDSICSCQETIFSHQETMSTEDQSLLEIIWADLEAQTQPNASTSSLLLQFSHSQTADISNQVTAPSSLSFTPTEQEAQQAENNTESLDIDSVLTEELIMDLYFDLDIDLDLDLDLDINLELDPEIEPQ